MATLETLDILFKSSGKSDILKDINDIEKRWSDITKNVVENIQKIVELRKELSNVNDLTKETVDLIEKEALAKKSVVNEEKKLEKIKNRGLAQQGRKEKQREKTEKQRKMAEKAREKANRSERGGGSGSSGGGTFWGNLGGLSSFLNLGMDFVKAGFTAVKTITGWAMEHGQIGVAVKRISEGQNEKETQNVLSDLVRSGWARGVSQGTVISAVSQLRQQFDEAFRLGGTRDFFDRFALGGASFQKEDFLGFLNSILRPKNAQQTTALRSALSPELAEAFLAYKKGTGGNLYENIEESIKVMKNIKEALESTKSSIVNSLSPAINSFAKEIKENSEKFGNWLRTTEGKNFSMQLKSISESLAEIIPLLVNAISYFIPTKKGITREVNIQSMTRNIPDKLNKFIYGNDKKKYTFIPSAIERYAEDSLREKGHDISKIFRRTDSENKLVENLLSEMYDDLVSFVESMEKIVVPFTGGSYIPLKYQDRNAKSILEIQIKSPDGVETGNVSLENGRIIDISQLQNEIAIKSIGSF